MIISHKHKFIFIKTNKTAGTSVEIALSRFCGPDDVVTPISREDEVTRRELGGAGPQNYLAAVSAYGWGDVWQLVSRGRRKKAFYNHISAAEIRATVGAQVWETYFKFCIERNPWDRTVSAYYWKHDTEPRPSLTHFIDSGYPLKLRKRGFELYTIDGEVAVDAVCRFEHLADDLDLVRRRIGLHEPLVLPRAKARFRKEKVDYREYFNAFDADRIGKTFAEEIAQLGYVF